MHFTRTIALLFSLAFFAACSQENFEMQNPRISDYFPLQTGKFITYKMDSTSPARFGSDTVVRSYQVRYMVDQVIKDGEDRDAYRVYRQIRPLNSAGEFTDDLTFTATPIGEQQMLWMENNQRFSKLYFPINEGFSWKGNSYINTDAPENLYMNDWQYTYENVGGSVTINGKTFDNTITVNHIDEERPSGPFSPDVIKVIIFSREIYAKDIGLIYRNSAYLEWQPSTGNRQGFWTDNSYRIILSIIDHN